MLFSKVECASQMWRSCIEKTERSNRLEPLLTQRYLSIIPAQSASSSLSVLFITRCAMVWRVHGDSGDEA